MSKPIDLLNMLFNGAVSGAQGLGRLISTAFQSVFHEVTISDAGVVTYGETYTELAEFMMTFAGVGIGFGAAFMFVRWLRARKRG